MRVSTGMSEVVLTVGPAHTLRSAAKQMVEKGIGAALVQAEDWPVPQIITERDVLKSVAAGQDPDQELVEDHMSENVIAASPEWSLERAAMEMSKRHIRHLAVYKEGELVGILSMRDIMRVWTSDGATSGGPP